MDHRRRLPGDQGRDQRAEGLGIAAVEMEAAALYAYARARDRVVICVAHVTNTMAIDGNDFEKGDADGVHDTLTVVAAIVARLAGSRSTAQRVGAR